MKSIIINKVKVKKPTKAEPTRTRWNITALCTRCNCEYTKLNKLPTDKYCGNCEKQLQNIPKWFEKMYSLYGDKYSYERVFFLPRTPVTETKVVINCNHHGYFATGAATLINTNRSKEVGGCPKCATDFQAIKNRIPHEAWVERLKEKVGDKVELISDTSDMHSTDKVTLHCKEHGEVTTTLLRLRDSNLVCPNCSWEQAAFKNRYHRTDVPGVVYFMHLPKIGKWKLGVTYRDVTRRQTELGGKDYCQIVWTYDCTTLKEAYELEALLFYHYKDSRYRGPRLLSSGGYTELLNIPIPKPEKAFIEEILCLKNLKRGNP